MLLGLRGRLGALFNPPNPDCRASLRSLPEGGGGRRRAGKLGGDSSALPFGCASSPDGRRGGNRGGGGDSSRAAGRGDSLGRDSEGDDFLPRKAEIFDVNPLTAEDDLDSGRGIGFRSAGSSFGRLGGSAGSSVVPHAGALIRLFPLEFKEVVEAPRPTLGAVVAAVECDASEVIDSIDGLRVESPVGFRGGNAGRAGSSGAAGSAEAAGAAERPGGSGGGGGRSDLRVGTGGGAFLGFTSGLVGGCGTGRLGRSPAGSFPIAALSKTEPVTLYDGGLLADLLRSAPGRGNGGSKSG